jgi:hypothetical protein
MNKCSLKYLLYTDFYRKMLFGRAIFSICFKDGKNFCYFFRFRKRFSQGFKITPVFNKLK